MNKLRFKISHDPERACNSGFPHYNGCWQLGLLAVTGGSDSFVLHWTQPTEEDCRFVAKHFASSLGLEAEFVEEELTSFRSELVNSSLPAANYAKNYYYRKTPEEKNDDPRPNK